MSKDVLYQLVSGIEPRVPVDDILLPSLCSNAMELSTTYVNHRDCSHAQNQLHTFPRNFLVDGEVANLLATSRCNGIWETTRHNRHDGRLPAPTCYKLVADLLRGNCLTNCSRCSAVTHLMSIQRTIIYIFVN